MADGIGIGRSHSVKNVYVQSYDFFRDTDQLFRYIIVWEKLCDTRDPRHENYRGQRGAIG